MNARLILLLCCFLSASGVTFGQEEVTEEPEEPILKKHFVFWNMSHVLDPNGHSLQAGYSYQYLPWMDLQIEAGLVSDNVINTSSPFQEYVGFRIRPQVKFLNKKSLFKDGRWYGGILFSYQKIEFKERQTFVIDESYNRNISFSGSHQILGGYFVVGLDGKISEKILVSLSCALGRVYEKTNLKEGTIPQNAELVDDCLFFCRRNRLLPGGKVDRGGFILDFKVGYRF